MLTDRTVWAEYFERDQMPTFPCPRCDNGRVAADKGTLTVEEPLFSKSAGKLSEWEPDWIQERFSIRLRCSEEVCGEIVIVSGATKLVETYDDDGTWGYASALKPTSMFPAPRMIRIPANSPDSVRERIESAFALFWVDIGSSANSLRVSVEFLLDHLSVPRTTMSTKTGKQRDLDLNSRIQFFEKNNKEHGETFHALRLIGNLGSHGFGVTREVLLDALEIYEDALSEIIGGRKAYLETIKKKIISTKGAY